MYGRYGNDQLGNFLFVVYLVLFVVQFFCRGTIAGSVLITLGYLVIIVYFFRCFSRNIYKRQRENQMFLRAWNPVKNYFRFWRMRIQERGGTKKLYRCPKCHQTIRVPKGRGKIAITCPKCRFEFIKKT
jgi:DNA-directed RNA polymerase subunit RPC12/RpoP